ncbi:hypothetical protein [Leptolyngbya sp. CCY15150]|uniref:hypothetical protein n=1 Tax=Leptolyngbya sp. CCY15150 TaxID=2767772 RepID=UPI00194E1F43|nr:hypothetical protein [Leptolyngbya sp. CCY15150]
MPLVPDASTTQMMAVFHRCLLLEATQDQALHQAMLATMQPHSDPVNLVAFTFTGFWE